MNSMCLQNSSQRQSQSSVLILYLLLSTVPPLCGCGIPKLRCAQPGAASPQVFNWNNGAPYWNTAVTNLRQSNTSKDNGSISPKPANANQNGDGDRNDEKKPASDLNRDESQKRPANSGLQLVSFARPNQQTDENTVADKIKAIEDDLKRSDDTTTEPSDRSPSDAADGSSRQDLEKSSNSFGQTDYNLDSSIPGSSGMLPLAAFYDDPFLLGLINETLTGNQELKILAEEVQIASNEAYARSGEYRPFVTAGVGAGFEKSGLHTRNGAIESQLEVAAGRGFPDPLGNFMAVTNVSWELDIWKKLRNAQRAAAMRYLATQDGRNFLVTRLVAEVAENYYELLSLDSRLKNQLATIEIQQQSLAVAEAKKEAGKGTELAVQRFQAEVQKNMSECSILQQQIVEVENRINYLAGRFPQPVTRLDTEFLDLNLTVLETGVPSELLLQRADIREAENRISAAGLDVQVARARFYPSLSLTGGMGWNAFSTGFLFRSPESLVYGVAGDLIGPLINKRAIQAAYCSANAEQLQAIYEYQQTLLKAHIDVVNQITKVENYRRSIEVKKQQLTSLEASVEAATKLFQNAQAEYVEVLLAQREMMEARGELIDTKQEQLVAIVNAYQALGGGGF